MKLQIPVDRVNRYLLIRRYLLGAQKAILNLLKIGVFNRVRHDK